MKKTILLNTVHCHYEEGNIVMYEGAFWRVTKIAGESVQDITCLSSVEIERIQVKEFLSQEVVTVFTNLKTEAYEKAL